MKSNIGAFDGAFRTLLFIVSMVYAIITGAWYWMIPTTIIFGAAIIGWCPLYGIIGISTDNETKK